MMPDWLTWKVIVGVLTFAAVWYCVGLWVMAKLLADRCMTRKADAQADFYDDTRETYKMAAFGLLCLMELPTCFRRPFVWPGGAAHRELLGLPKDY